MAAPIYHQKADKIAKGERVIGDDRFLDWMITHSSSMSIRVRSIPNPDRVGLLDQYIIWTEPNP